jgi:hypothetical protein
MQGVLRKRLRSQRHNGAQRIGGVEQRDPSGAGEQRESLPKNSTSLAGSKQLAIQPHMPVSFLWIIEQNCAD